MPYLTREQILNANDLPAEDVEVPEWGGVVRVRALTGAERDAFEAAIIKVRGKRVDFHLENARALLVAMSVVDEDGNRLFSDEDVKALGRKSAAALDRVASVAMRLSGLTQEDLEELTKN
jgi:hypothetical protein